MSPSLATVLAVTVPLIVVVQFIVIRIGYPALYQKCRRRSTA